MGWLFWELIECPSYNHLISFLSAEPFARWSAFDSAFHLVDYTERGINMLPFLFTIVCTIAPFEFLREGTMCRPKARKSWYRLVTGCRGKVTDGDNQIILMLIVLALYGESCFQRPLFFVVHFASVIYVVRFAVFHCVRTMFLHRFTCIGSCVRNAEVKATAGQWFVCTSPTVNFILCFFCFALYTRVIYIPSTLSSALYETVVTSSLLQCTWCIGRDFRYWWCF